MHKLQTVPWLCICGAGRPSASNSLPSADYPFWRQKQVRTNCQFDPPPRAARRPPARRPPRQALGSHRSPPRGPIRSATRY